MVKAVNKIENHTKENRVNVVGLCANVCSLESVIRKVNQMIESGNGGYVCFSTVHMVMESYDHPEYGAKVNSADLVVTDGMPLVWMQKLQGAKEASRVRANDLMIALCQYAEKNDLSVGFYGGRLDVIDAIVKRAARETPKLKIAYTFSPPFRHLTEQEDAQIIREINEKAPDILFVGLGCPKQENWMWAHKNKLKSVMLGVGASFDFYAGNVKESPAWMGKLGLEWLYRLTQEPKRLWKRYLILNPRFIWLAILQLFGLKKF
ncbi:MAG TPA: WecB/TagA/CpsF family glycosyltransferase [Pyrinomonadaceae bacterium]|jgi:N-acetylglucosaminyldiphosphoundecaprenol N-acetyl-beta-D-mannosaminyltransferase